VKVSVIINAEGHVVGTMTSARSAAGESAAVQGPSELIVAASGQTVRELDLPNQVGETTSVEGLHRAVKEALAKRS
jgi:hypothetical protein